MIIRHRILGVGELGDISNFIGDQETWQVEKSRFKQSGKEPAIQAPEKTMTWQIIAMLGQFMDTLSFFLVVADHCSLLLFCMPALG